MNSQNLINNLTRFEELLYKEIITPEYLTIPDILSGTNGKNLALIDQKLLYLAEAKQKEFDELISIIVTDKKILDLDNSYKIAFLVNTLIPLAGVRHGK